MQGGASFRREPGVEREIVGPTEREAPDDRVSTVPLRAFHLADPTVPPPVPKPAPFPRLAAGVALSAFAIALLLVAVARGVVLRALLPVALALVAIGIVARTIYSARGGRNRGGWASELPPKAPNGARRLQEPSWGQSATTAELALSRRGIWLRDTSTDRVSITKSGGSRRVSSPTLLLRLDGRDGVESDDVASAPAPVSLGALAFEQPFEPQPDAAASADMGAFGVTLLSNRRRTRVVAAITSRAGTLLVGTRLDEEERQTHAPLLARCSVLGGDEAAFEATAPDGRPLLLSASDFSTLLDAFEALDPGCTNRIVLSDQKGDAIRLDGEAFLVRGRVFDLSLPLEWRPILFQEAFGQAITLFQGTWVRQGGVEIVLVSLLSPTFFDASLGAPPSSPSPSSDGAKNTDQAAPLEATAARDHRLLYASAADPPPIDQRVAMDGLFVVPLRAALDQAPRPSSQPRSVPNGSAPSGAASDGSEPLL